MLMEIHVYLETLVCSYHFKRVVLAAVVFWKGPLVMAEISSAGCLAVLLVLLWRTVHLFMSVPRAGGAARLPSAPSKKRNKGHILPQESGGKRKRASESIRLKWRECRCVHSVKRSVSIDAFVVGCHVQYCTVYCTFDSGKTHQILCTKGLFHAPLFRLYSKKQLGG